MVAYGDTYETLAKGLNMSVQTLCNKTFGKTEFSRSEIEGMIKRYNLTASEVMEIFFAPECNLDKHILEQVQKM